MNGKNRRRTRTSLIIGLLIMTGMSACARLPAPTPNPNPLPSTASPTETRLPTQTPTEVPKTSTPTPVLPTHYPMPTGLPTSDKERRENVASISREEAEQYSREELLKVLVSRWLEGYVNTTISRSKIDDYYMGEVTIISHSTEPDADIIAWVDFSIVPAVKTHNYWGAAPGTIDPDGLWWHLSLIFGVVRKGDTFWLSLLPGWGT